MDTAPHRLPARVPRPASRRSAAIRADSVLGRRAASRAESHPNRFEDQQRSARAQEVALSPRCPDREMRRHAAARPTRGVDGPNEIKLGLDCAVRGVAQPGSAPRLGRGGPRFKSGRPDCSQSARRRRFGYSTWHQLAGGQRTPVRVLARETSTSWPPARTSPHTASTISSPSTPSGKATAARRRRSARHLARHAARPHAQQPGRLRRQRLPRLAGRRAREPGARRRDPRPWRGEDRTVRTGYARGRSSTRAAATLGIEQFTHVRSNGRRVKYFAGSDRDHGLSSSGTRARSRAARGTVRPCRPLGVVSRRAARARRPPIAERRSSALPLGCGGWPAASPRRTAPREPPTVRGPRPPGGVERD